MGDGMENKNWPHVYWIGGSPCSGKSTVAAMLAEVHGMTLYRCDDHFHRHLEQATPDAQPELSRIRQMGWDDIWMRPLDEMLASQVRAYREEFPMICDDLRSMYGGRGVIADGAALMPDLVLSAHALLTQSIWIVPARAFQLKCYSEREWVKGILSECSAPGEAFANWMARDAAYADLVEAQCRDHEQTLLVNCGETSAEGYVQFLEQHFELNDSQPGALNR